MNSTNNNSLKPDENEVDTPETLLELPILITLDRIINSWPSKELQIEDASSQSIKERIRYVCKSIHYDIHGLSILIDMLHQHGTQRNSVATPHDIRFISAVVEQYVKNIKHLYDLFVQSVFLVLLPQFQWQISIDSCRTLLEWTENINEETRLPANLTKLLQINQSRFDAFQQSYRFVCHSKKDLQFKVRTDGYDMKNSLVDNEATDYQPLLPFLRDMTWLLLEFSEEVAEVIETHYDGFAELPSHSISLEGGCIASFIEFLNYDELM